jgi:hypothetical protein
VRLSRRACVAAATLAMGLIGAAGAGGHAVARSVNIPRGGHATFLQSGGWRCNNYGNRVRCFSGDAHPLRGTHGHPPGWCDSEGLHAPRPGGWDNDGHIREGLPRLRLHAF